MKPEDKHPVWLTIREKCAMGCQCCDECNDLICVDNTNPLVSLLKEMVHMNITYVSSFGQLTGLFNKLKILVKENRK